MDRSGHTALLAYVVDLYLKFNSVDHIVSDRTTSRKAQQNAVFVHKACSLSFLCPEGVMMFKND